MLVLATLLALPILMAPFLKTLWDTVARSLLLRQKELYTSRLGLGRLVGGKAAERLDSSWKVPSLIISL